MRPVASLIGFIALMIVLIIVVLASADWIDGIKTKTEAKCTAIEQALGECKPPR